MGSPVLGVALGDAASGDFSLVVLEKCVRLVDDRGDPRRCSALDEPAAGLCLDESAPRQAGQVLGDLGLGEAHYSHQLLLISGTVE